MGWYSSSGWLSLRLQGSTTSLALLSSTSWRSKSGGAPEGGVNGINAPTCIIVVDDSEYRKNMSCGPNRRAVWLTGHSFVGGILRPSSAAR
ncbi:Uncharacterised protein [Mycobacterium tuberculosis]|uniref:Uncharacterized protein n=1 Tax=Mycobacterium tuberculosis TaxID=1773 RepID=A0A655FYT9_MYCTX|nr:Uncharacterised protein [Mycobacterium tuberculosis]CKQ92782.1 Uncharacterised protein [Mycobacterium tuberculosis]CKQ97189.1 Uncharacterised protein [Mycobacterium tuberculosis]CKS05940.1 Uncharacterised protein [Mycobacterium tuberculosis]CKT30585.1 Uncharacterised protein [Mycobacterium tuberculosis]